MKKLNAQFAAVFVGVLLLHLAAASALMRSAKTGESGASVAASSIDPYYHSTPEKPSPPTASTEIDEAADSERELPNAFATDSDSTTPEIAAPPIPDSSVTSIETDSSPMNPKPAPEVPSTGRRLTVTQLLAADPPKAPESRSEVIESGSSVESLPKVKPLPAGKQTTGPRTVRSLSGN